jgi:DNA processing protein
VADQRSAEEDRRIEATIALAEAEGLGPGGVAKLIEHFGSAAPALEADAEEWGVALRISPSRAERLRASARRVDPVRVIEEHAAIGAWPAVLGGERYPVLLAAIPDPPPVLWIRGELSATDAAAIAIVGARRASPYGLDQAARFATVLAQRGHPVVSGGARGIDAAAHRAALRAGGRTIAVLGSGLGAIYPPEHGPLFEAIVAGGGAVASEFGLCAGPRREHFPRRNRILSGWSLGVLVVEAWARSGAAITARIAVEDHGRDAFALPGRVDSPASEGCLQAIRSGWAALVRSPADLLEDLGHAGYLVRGATEETRSLPLGDARACGERLLRLGEAFAEELLPDRPVGEILATLTLLELQGYARRCADGRFAATQALREVCGSRTGERRADAPSAS